MAQIYEIVEPTLELPEIRVALMATDESETGEPEPQGNNTMQTQINGIQDPLFALNGIVIERNSLQYFHLDASGHLPTIEFEFQDTKNRFSNISDVGNENELQVQILPPFDNAYKKINLLFYVTRININGGVVSGRAQYKVPGLTQSRYMAFGEITTYEMCKQIAEELGMGFAANVESTEDPRYIYCDFKSYFDLLDSETSRMEAGEARVIDWWVDLWNNLILCDLYDRYKSEDAMEDNKIWVSEDSSNGVPGVDIEPVEVEPVFTNVSVATGGYNITVDDYHTLNNQGTGYSAGTQRLEQIYDINRCQWVDNYIADGDIEKNATLKYEYGGEFYGEYNYILAEKCRNMFKQKMDSETIVLGLNRPYLGLNRGDQIRFVWYDNDSATALERNSLEQVGLPPAEQTQNLGWLADYILEKDENDMNPMTLNLQVSGQYTIIGQRIIYENQVWGFEMILTRPADKKIKQLPEDE